MPGPQAVVPNSADPGDRLTVTIKGDALSGTVASSFGFGVLTGTPRVVDGGTVLVKIQIDPNTASGPRDVLVTNSRGETGVLPAGFIVN
jgi:hypothetical protein